VRLGLRANLAQFTLLVGVNALVGGMIGQERTVLPLIATRVFHLHAYTAVLTYIVAFGAVKAATNFVAGTLSERTGRKPVLVAGWLIGVPVPFLLAFGPGWAWIIAANILLGINQGLTWSTTVIMKIDLVGPERRGLAMGLNEAAGYGAVAITALVTGIIAARAGLRPDPFFLGMAFAGLGLGLSTLFVRETQGHARLEGRTHVAASPGVHDALSTREVFVLTSFREKALSASCQAGMVNNLNDGLAWGIFPIFFARHGLSVGRIGVLVALYPAVWGLGQLVTGALSDRWGRKWLIATGMWAQAVGIGLIASVRGFWPWAGGALVLGTGTAMVYPTLLAAIGDVAHPSWRASSIGVYRLWRDGGFAVGALLAGAIADWLGLAAAIWSVAAITALSGVVVALRMYETHAASQRAITHQALAATPASLEPKNRPSAGNASTGTRLADSGVTAAPGGRRHDPML
jgi:MFS family permease